MTAVWAHSAVAQLGESASDIGQQMLGWFGGKTAQLPRRLTVNGLELGLVSGVSDASIHEVFEGFSAQCKKRAGLAVDGVFKQRLMRSLGQETQEMLQGVLRRESPEQGIIVCLDTDQPLEPKEAIERIERYAKDHDLSTVGGLRAIVARRMDKRTQLLLVGAAGKMDLSLAFPSEGDVPGKEPNSIPRPPKSRRLLDTAEHGADNALHIYESQGESSESVLQFYRTQLPRLGWVLTAGARPGALMAEQRQRRLLILAKAATGEGVRTSLVELSR